MNKLKTRWASLERLFIDQRTFEKTRWIIAVFYYFLEFMAINQFAVSNAVAATDPHPIWPIFWLNAIPDAGVRSPYIFLPLLLFGTTIGALFYRNRIARIVTFLSVLEFQSYLVSILGSEHEFYVPLFTSFLFIFLPDIWVGVASEGERRKFMLIFWASQSYLLLVYFMSGFAKVLGVFEQLHEANYFSFDAAALYVSFYLEQFHRTSILGPFIVAHPLFGWLGLMMMLYLTLSCITIILRPALHRLWGFGLVMFHVSTLLSINLMFYHYPFFAALFMLGSPFAPDRNSWSTIISELPIFGHIFKFILNLKRGILGAYGQTKGNP